MEIHDEAIEAAYRRYLDARVEVYGAEKAAKRPQTLMDLATIGAKVLKKRGMLPELDESEEINACSIHVNADVNGQTQDWLLMFKNETHNHPTEIEPFGGAATCIGGCIRDPLSGRAYVHQAMRVTGAGDPRAPLDQTLPGKLPQRKLLSLIHISRTMIPGVVSDIGGFGGLFAPDIKGMAEPVLVSGTDGVGTKIRIAQLLDKHDTIGIDCVAMCVNDIICCVAKPLFFLDYIAIGKNEPEKVASIVSGVAEGCVQSGCALIGGETAEHPGMMAAGDYDLAGFSVDVYKRQDAGSLPPYWTP